jgi:hypothetical protein
MARRERMDEDALAALVDHQIADAGQFATSDLITGRDRALEYVRGEVNDIPAEPGKSSITSRDLSDVLNWIMPGLLRVFLASDRVAIYEPNKREIGPDGQDISKERAEQATDYLNYTFLTECDGYRVLQSAFYDGLLLGNGIIKHWWDDTPEYETRSFTGLTDDQYLFLVSHPDVEKVLEHSERQEWEPGASEPDHGPSQAPAQIGILPSGAGIAGGGMGAGNGTLPSEMAGGGPGIPQVGQAPSAVEGGTGAVPQTLHDCKIKRRVSEGRLRVEALPPEEFLIERNAKALDENVRFCAHYYQTTRSDLIERGYDREKVDEMQAGTSGSAFDSADLSRDGAGLMTQAFNAPDRATEPVDVYECYVLCDYDGDGIAERRRVVMAGGVGKLAVVENEEWDDDLPFSDLVPEPVPHRWKGRSLYDELQDVVRVKTTLVRQTLDNLYMTNNPMTQVIENSVTNMDALINRRIGANIFVKQTGAVAPLETPFTAKESFSMLEYWDQIIEKRTGVSRSTMGMDPDALQNQTAEAVRDSRAASATKTESYARNMAELGMKRMFRCILNLITKHQDRPRTIRLRGKWVEMKPDLWDPNMDVSVNTGLGTGSRDRDLMLLNGVLTKQELILQTMGPQNPVVGLEEYRNTLAKAAESSGLKGIEQYFKEVTPETLQQHAQMTANQPDPKAQEAQAKLQLEGAKLQMTAQIEQGKAQTQAQIAEREAQNKYQLDLARAQHDAELQQMQLERQAQIEQRQAEADIMVGREKAAATLELERAKFEFEREKALMAFNLERELKLMELQMRSQERQQAQQDTAEREAAQPTPEPQRDNSGLAQGLSAIAEAMKAPKTVVHQQPNGQG